MVRVSLLTGFSTSLVVQVSAYYEVARVSPKYDSATEIPSQLLSVVPDYRVDLKEKGTLIIKVDNAQRNILKYNEHTTYVVFRNL